jgi:hypothetical protein
MVTLCIMVTLSYFNCEVILIMVRLSPGYVRFIKYASKASLRAVTMKNFPPVFTQVFLYRKFPTSFYSSFLTLTYIEKFPTSFLTLTYIENFPPVFTHTNPYRKICVKFSYIENFPPVFIQVYSH